MGACRTSIKEGRRYYEQERFFNFLSKFYKNMKNADKKAVAKSFGIGYTYLESWLESISYVRNVCAHYGRLYNAKLSKTPILYKEYTQAGIGNNRMFGVLLCMKQILKKNQIIISVIAIMLIAAGYMNYTSNEKQVLETAVLTDSEKYAGIGDATLVSANVADNNDLVNNNEGQNIAADSVKSEEKKDEIKSNEQNTENKENDKNTVPNEVNTSTNVTETSGDQYFAELRLERDKMYSQMLESYQKILSNSQISETQKEISENEIKKINDTRNAIMIAENLIKNKGFEDLIIFINGDSISIIVKAKELKEEQIAQIQNIISRELKGEIENIHISNKE